MLFSHGYKFYLFDTSEKAKTKKSNYPSAKKNYQFPISYFTPSVIPFHLSVLKGVAGKPSLLKRLSLPASSAQPNRTANGWAMLSDETTTLSPFINALA